MLKYDEGINAYFHATRTQTVGIYTCRCPPTAVRQRLLAHVWCGHCRHETTITNFNGTIKDGELLLVGRCAECHGDVARVIEL